MLTTHRHGYTIRVERAIMPHPNGEWLSTVTDDNPSHYVLARQHRPNVRLAFMQAFYDVDALIALEGVT